MMDNAIWNNKEIYVTDILKDKELVSAMSFASKNGDIKCPHCNNKIQYCHGNIRTAYFRHRKNETCDYIKYANKDTKKTRLIRRKLYEHFSKQYEILTDLKIIEHHFTPIIIKKQNDNQLAIDFILNNNLEQTKYLLSEYKKINLPVCFIDLSITLQKNNIKELSKTKRYILDYSIQNSILAIDLEYEDDEPIIRQYKLDIDEYNDSLIAKDDIYYSDLARINDLIIKNCELCINTFDAAFNIWKDKKHNKDSTNNTHKPQKTCYDYIGIEFNTLNNTNNYQDIASEYNNKLYTCIICKQTKPAKEFSIQDRDGTGICRNCIHNDNQAK